MMVDIVQWGMEMYRVKEVQNKVKQIWEFNLAMSLQNVYKTKSKARPLLIEQITGSFRSRGFIY